MAVSQLGYIGIGVSNMDKWEEYLQEVLGMEVVERAKDGTVYVRMDELHHRLALYPNGQDDVLGVGWQTANRKAFEATKDSLLACGVEFQQATPEEIANRHVVDMVKFDLSGFPLEVYYGPHVVFEKNFNSPVGLRGFKTGELGLGHVGMNVDDAKKAARILEEGLGFLVSDNFNGNDRFFHCNPREHTAVLGSRNERDPKRLQHFMVEVNHIDDVGFAYQRVEERGIELTSRLQRHTNDHMMSFYMRTPSGFRLEYGWGGRLIDDSTWQVNGYKSASIWRSGAPAAQPAAPAAR
jgi:2,3-dihydroxybiphenyl 1,2-dioxygenase